MKRTKLSKAQMKVMDRLNGELPMDDGTSHLCWWELKRHEDGTISGQFNASTLEALEKRGLIEIVELDKTGNYDVIRLIKGGY